MMSCERSMYDLRLDLSDEVFQIIGSEWRNIAQCEGEQQREPVVVSFLWQVRKRPMRWELRSAGHKTQSGHSVHAPCVATTPSALHTDDIQGFWMHIHKENWRYRRPDIEKRESHHCMHRLLFNFRALELNPWLVDFFSIRWRSLSFTTASQYWLQTSSAFQLFVCVSLSGHSHCLAL